jgi:hypothetical protein
LRLKINSIMATYSSPSLSLFIVRIFPNITKEFIQDILENKLEFGKVSKIDFVSKKDKKEQEYNSAYIYFESFTNREETNHFLQQMENSEGGRIFYKRNQFWRVFKNTLPNKKTSPYTYTQTLSPYAKEFVPASMQKLTQIEESIPLVPYSLPPLPSMCVQDLGITYPIYPSKEEILEGGLAKDDLEDTNDYKVYEDLIFNKRLVETLKDQLTEEKILNMTLSKELEEVKLANGSLSERAKYYHSQSQSAFFCILEELEAVRREFSYADREFERVELSLTHFSEEYYEAQHQRDYLRRFIASNKFRQSKLLSIIKGDLSEHMECMHNDADKSDDSDDDSYDDIYKYDSY